MSFIHRYITEHKTLFAFMKSEHVFPHDHFLNWLLLWAIPRTITPNQITLIRIALTPVVFILTLYDYYIAGIILFLLLALSDAIDGSMARTRDQVTAFGVMFDPVADKLLIGSMVLIIVFDNYPAWIGLTVLGLEILFISSMAFAKMHFNSVPMANLWGKLKMITQVIAVFLTLAGLLLQTPEFFTVGAWVFGIAIGFAVMSLFSRGI